MRQARGWQRKDRQGDEISLTKGSYVEQARGRREKEGAGKGWRKGVWEEPKGCLGNVPPRFVSEKKNIGPMYPRQDLHDTEGRAVKP